GDAGRLYRGDQPSVSSPRRCRARRPAANIAAEAGRRVMTSPLRLGTRGSPLALFQAQAVADAVLAAAGRPCEIIVIRTSGDKLAEASLSEIGGKRLFVKEIEDALLSGDIDLAVPS